MAELIHVLEATRLVEQKSNMFDEPIPNDPTPVLQPTPWRPWNVSTKTKQNIKNFATKNMQKKEKNSLLWVCKRLKILANGCWITYKKNQVVDKVLESFKNKIDKKICKER